MVKKGIVIVGTGMKIASLTDFIIPGDFTEIKTKDVNIDIKESLQICVNNTVYIDTESINCSNYLKGISIDKILGRKYKKL